LKTALIAKSILPERRFVFCGDRFDGILACLTRNCDENVSDCGIVEIRSSSVFDENCLPTNAASFT
jgi:hypothetical protein